jgi:Mrp family chromosome partitioning ATPase
VVFADAAILARFADVILHVVRWGRTKRSVVLDAVDRLRRANGKAVSATVFNRVTPAKYYKYNRDGGWGFRYADYYRTASETAASKL